MGFGLLYIPSARAGSTTGAVYEAVFEEVVAAEALGWDIAWIAEHHFDALGGLVPSPAMLGAALAMRTRRIRIGAAVVILPMRDGLQVAEDYAMLDVLSGGRLELGLGRGFSRHEFRSAGIAMESRQRRFEEGLAVLLKAWSGQVFSYEGDYYHLRDIELFPRPVQQPRPPIWVAVSLNRESFELAGREGFNLMLNPYSRSLEEIRQGLAWYREGLALGGQAMGSTRIMVNYHLYCAADEEAARRDPRLPLIEYLESIDRAFRKGDESRGAPLPPRRYEDMYPGRVMFGPPELLAAKIRFWQQQGVTDFCFMSQFGSLDPALSLASIQLFTREVMPLFR